MVRELTKKCPPDAAQREGHEPTLARRVAFRSAGGLLALPLNLLLQAIVLRGLGPSGYGDYSYLSSFFTAVVNFGDNGTSQAYYNKLSKRPLEFGLNSFYARYAGGILASLTLAIVITFEFGAASRLWPGISAAVIALAAWMTFGNWLLAVATKTTDAYALTQQSETASLIVRFLLVMTSALMYAIDRLTLTTFLALQSLFNALLLAALASALARHGRLGGFFSHLPLTTLRRYGKEFWRYCHPLFTLSIVTVLASLLDRWLLQHIAGSVQQGYLGFGLQVGGVVFIFGGAIATLLAREFARAHQNGDLSRLRRDFSKYLPFTYAVTAYFGVFLAVQSPAIVQLFGGTRFANATATTAILCLYPLHQVYGQLGGAVMYATDRTSAARDVSIAGILVGIALTYLFVAPHQLGGLQMGAEGLALKILITQIVVVNAILWANTRYLEVRLWPLVVRQVTIPAILGALAWAADAAVAIVAPEAAPRFLAAGVIYTALTLAVAIAWPASMGLERGELGAWISRARTRHWRGIFPSE